GNKKSGLYEDGVRKDRLDNDDMIAQLESRIRAKASQLDEARRQIFYGDESARPFGPTGSDPLQGTRSDMNWQDVSGKSAAAVAH
ncbi:hypothetical protein MJN51_38140, partial [Salmonella enterica subsp. enterica serovar Kentucky]|nr:hypothetical protein [Salmonella enterica subsp. enterica serovar Kentucky]